MDVYKENKEKCDYLSYVLVLFCFYSVGIGGKKREGSNVIRGKKYENCVESRCFYGLVLGYVKII